MNYFECTKYVFRSDVAIFWVMAIENVGVVSSKQTRVSINHPCNPIVIVIIEFGCGTDLLTEFRGNWIKVAQCKSSRPQSR
jgi:hypothetical protein